MTKSPAPKEDVRTSLVVIVSFITAPSLSPHAYLAAVSGGTAPLPFDAVGHVRAAAKSREGRRNRALVRMTKTRGGGRHRDENIHVYIDYRIWGLRLGVKYLLKRAPYRDSQVSQTRDTAISIQQLRKGSEQRCDTRAKLSEESCERNREF